MKFCPEISPTGSFRDWLDFRAETQTEQVSHVFADTGDVLTWDEVRNKARDVARYLTSLQVPKGESVAICMPNGREAVVCLFGILYGGFRATALNLAAGNAALSHAISHSRCRYIFSTPDTREILDAALSQAALSQAALSETDNQPKVIETEVGSEIRGPENQVLHKIRPDNHALLMYTSGTTGVPKGVVHTHKSLLAGGWTTAVAHKLEDQDRAMCVLPFYHINGLCVTLIAPLISGGSVVMVKKFSSKRFWAICREYKVSWFSVVPTIISHLLHSEQSPDQATKLRIRFGRSASAPLSPQVQSAFEVRFSIPIIETMGLTETAAQILSNPLPPGLRKIGSPGVAVGNEVAILGPELDVLPTNSKGELAVRGPNVMREYLFNPEVTAATFTDDRWLRTGDIGYIDTQGYVFVTGRLKELIIKGGENIAPREIDEALYCHEDVVEAAAFAVPCPVYGQKPLAAVAVRANSQVSEEDLLTVCHQKLGAFKSPENIFFLQELPKGPSGKIQRRKLVAMFSD